MGNCTAVQNENREAEGLGEVDRSVAAICHAAAASAATTTTKKMSSSAILERDFPTDILHTIFAFLDEKDLCEPCACVNKMWRGIAESDYVWERRCESLWEGKSNVTIGIPFQYAKYATSVDLSVKS